MKLLAMVLVAAAANGHPQPVHTKHELAKIHKANPACNTWKCVKRVQKKNYAKAWKHWTRLYIPSCTWVGESGPGPQFANWRYSVPNTGGSGAFGKYQLMPRTYYAFARRLNARLYQMIPSTYRTYTPHHWSPLEQEIAAHRLFWAQGTSPWQAC